MGPWGPWAHGAHGPKWAHGPIWAPGPWAPPDGKDFFEKKYVFEKTVFFCLGLRTYLTRIGRKFCAGGCSRFVKRSHMCRETLVYVFVPNMCT